MLVDIIKKINTNLTREQLIEILYRLIHFDCGKRLPPTDMKPYNELRPMLNEHYTTTFINNIKDAQYNPSQITSILVHLYRYSIVSNTSNIASLTLQPYVTLNMKADGEYIISYETFNDFDHNAKILHMNDLKYIKEPIEFIEKPCIVDIDSNTDIIDDMEHLYSPEKCDQYIATQMMLREVMSSACSTISQKRNTVPNNMSNKYPRDMRSLPYYIGYYYYNLKTNNSHYNI